MKYIIGMIFVVGMLNAQDYWSGCGENKQEAKNDLAANILVQVETSIKQEVTSTFSLGFEDVSKDIELKESQSSTMLLTGLIDYKNDLNQTCVKVSKADLKKFTEDKIKHLDSNYAISGLSKNVKDRAVMIDEWLVSLKFIKGLSSVFANIDQKNLNHKIAQLKDIRDKLATQYVKIVVHGSQISTDSKVKEISKMFFDKPSILLIDKKIYDFSRENFLKAGKHTYTISGEHCKISDEFKLEKNEDKTISVNLDDYAFPSLLISSNKDEVKLKIDGEAQTLGQKKIFKHCDGDVHYELSYAYGKPEKVSDDITLEPGLEENLEYSFLSNDEIKELNALVATFKKGKRLELSYEYSLTDPNIVNGDTISGLHQFGASYLEYKDWLRYGYRVRGGFGQESSFSVQATYMAALQITTFGADKKAFRLSNIAVIVPYFGLELGLGYASLYDSSTSSYVTSFKSTPTDETNFVDDYLVFKPLVGADFIVSENMSIGLELSKTFTMQKSYNLGLHLSLGL